ncbi:hypothetical protein OEV98_13545 [Caldibacillus lycopersici]|uniref:Uncharacterized protein n=1 Tax=Perspicuibacillus lycopersici TaxID=1325689 RepID=A0AAE3LTV2_9BACI|nr:hypothetical protein [Perspicuibacillus lycopersici]MCU9614563.1 hypothetical protein [Perspicuibacillus lycopersici]
MEVFLGNTNCYSIPDETVPAFYYCCRAWGFQVDMDVTAGRITLLPGLSNKRILLLRDQHLQSSLRMERYEEQMLQFIQNSLKSSGVQYSQSEQEKVEALDLSLSIFISQLPYLQDTTLEIYCSPAEFAAEWINEIKSECEKHTIKLVIHEIDEKETYQKVACHILYPMEMEASFWEKVGKSLAAILSLGLLHKLQGDNRQSLLSIFPLEHWLKAFTTTMANKEIALIEETAQEIMDTQVQRNQPAQKNILARAESFFDYHLFLMKNKTPKIFGGLSLKNTGNVLLRNPIICFRISPPGSVSFNGQILPPNAIQTQGIQTSDGPKGWRYMYDHWQEDAQEKGEIWICPINELTIAPDENISLSNIQMKVNDMEHVNSIKIEAYTFFSEHKLEIVSNNKISLLLN